MQDSFFLSKNSPLSRAKETLEAAQEVQEGRESQAMAMCYY